VEWVALSWASQALESLQARYRRTRNHAIQARSLRWNHRVAGPQGRRPRSSAVAVR
jgi:hypothetical protein